MIEGGKGASLNSYRLCLLAVALFLGMAILLGVQAKGAGPLPGDLAFSRFIQSALPYNERVQALWAVIGEVLHYSPYLVFAITLGLRRWDWAILVALVCLPIALFGESQLKPIFGRPRPTDEFLAIYQVSKGLSFPSGTALNSMATVGVVFYLLRLSGTSKVAISRLIFGLGISFLLLANLARIHVGAHWLTDILGGWLFASAWVALWMAAHQWWLHQNPENAE